jgi:hypothetical protein
LVISATLRVELEPGEEAPPGFGRRDKWPEGLYALHTDLTEIDYPTGSLRAEQLERTLREYLQFFGTEPAAGFLGRGRGRLSLRITIDPVQGEFKLPADFLRAWGEMGGTIFIDIPLNP